MSMQTREIKPATYYDDVDWVDEHWTELNERCSAHWGAVSEGRVVAAHPALGRAKRQAAKEMGKPEDQISAFFVHGFNTLWCHCSSA